jgi:hypothetical protein
MAEITYRTAGDPLVIPACKPTGYPLDWWEMSYKYWQRQSQVCGNPRGRGAMALKARYCLQIMRHLQQKNATH